MAFRKTRKIGTIGGAEQALRQAEADSQHVRVPVLDVDPDLPDAGLVWIRRGSPHKLCVRVDDATRTVNLT